MSEVHLSQFACTATALAPSTKPTCGCNPMATDTYGYTIRAEQAYGDKQYYQRNPPTEEDQSMNKARLPPERLHERSALTEKTP